MYSASSLIVLQGVSAKCRKDFILNLIAIYTVTIVDYKFVSQLHYVLVILNFDIYLLEIAHRGSEAHRRDPSNQKLIKQIREKLRRNSGRSIRKLAREASVSSATIHRVN